MTRTRHTAGHFSQYIAEINEASLLTPDDERELAGRIAGGDPEARDRLVRANLRLVVNIARGYLDRGLLLDDLVSEGNLGLIRAAEGFDAAIGVRFSTYASYWIKQSIRRGVMNQGKPVRLPAYAVTLVAKWRRASAALEGRLGRTPLPSEVGRLLGLSPKKVLIAVEAVRAEECFGSRVCQAGEEGGPDAFDVPGRHGSPLEALAAEDDLSRVHEGLGRLDGRSASVIRLRFGLATGTPMTLREVGENLGLTRERVRQIEKQALAVLTRHVGETPRWAGA